VQTAAFTADWYSNPHFVTGETRAEDSDAVSDESMTLGEVRGSGSFQWSRGHSGDDFRAHAGV
jgi:hypothetical protein